MEKIIVPIKGMHCTSCEILVEDNLKEIPGVQSVKVNYKDGLAEVRCDQKPSETAIAKAVKAAGYSVGKKEKLPFISTKVEDYVDLAIAGFIVFALYVFGKVTGLFNLTAPTASTNAFVPLMVGLVAGVSTCMALVGGLVLSFSARHAEKHPEATPLEKFRPHLFFNAGRIAGYAVLGGLIGLIGKAFTPSANLLGLLTVIIGLVMIFFGLKLIEIFPALQNINLTLPTSVARFFGMKKEAAEYSHTATFMGGVATFFVPCGFTQAMQLYAVSTGSFWQGALTMGLFAIGTAPGLLGIGGLTSFFKGQKARYAFMAAGLAVIAFGWFNVANGRELMSFGTSTTDTNAVTSTGSEQVVRMTQKGDGYYPNTFTIEKGKPVKWVVTSESQFSCASSLVVPSLGISKYLKSGENVITFTPNKTGEIPFSCSMGMYRGKFIVVEKGASTNGVAPVAQNKARAVARGGGCGMMGGAAPVAAVTGDVAQDQGLQILKTTYTAGNDISPNRFTVKAGQPAELQVDVQDNGSGCMSTIMIEGLYSDPLYLAAGKTLRLPFTATKPGTYDITCAMGVGRGVITVIE